MSESECDECCSSDTSSSSSPVSPSVSPPPPSPSLPSSSSSSSVPSSSSSSSASESSEEPSATPTLTSSDPVSTPSNTPTPTPTPTRDPVNTRPSVVTQTSTVTSTWTIVPTRVYYPSHQLLTYLPFFRFFENTGAVAGVFSVVGLIVLAVIVALATNAVRRRRAKKFDREIEEAAREAAATQPPAGFLDDDDDYRRAGGYGGGSSSFPSGPYSDISSHGTFQQSPLQPHESYGMREIGGHGPVSGPGPAPGEVFNYGAAGAAGIGVARARSMRDGGNFGQALQDGNSPYPAFAAPSGPQQQPQHPYSRDYSRSDPADILEAAGMGSHIAGAGAGAATLNRGPSQYRPNIVSGGGYEQHQAQSADLNRAKSVRSEESGSVYSGVPSTAASQYYNSSRTDSYVGPGYPAMPSMPNNNNNNSNGYGGGNGHLRQRSEVVDEEDAYGGFVAQKGVGATSPGVFPNPFDSQQKSGNGEERNQRRFSEDEPRVLKSRSVKVAN
ncbi:hypothetical protein FA15DRAFT_687404 [Coprinopsis marcescibilis]|uniref:REJ domain-containing protein n=1 Tax=Coprinopsis marcescibilis TaxID=230819 RepID=A0A5C3KW62_COPMA|nr:hypothetical protein FA15DRAFT_687404 [Coprinopsis marcescibilis]